jgi:aryl-alcohol dehydrogenase-like predicted oxidoreductase
VVVSSKGPYLDEHKELLTPQAFEANLETSLRELGLETIDLYFIHGLRLPYYERSRDLFLPVLERARQAGKIRWIGVTEAFESDTRHEMLQRAVQDEGWEVMMVGYNLLNQTAAGRVLAFTHEKGIGTLGMFAVRRSLIDEGWLRILLRRLADSGEIDHALANAPDLLATLGLRGVSERLSEAAYRFCAYAPGLDCVLSGTSNADHLRENLKAVQRGPLPQATMDHLKRLFGRVESVSGQVR